MNHSRMHLPMAVSNFFTWYVSFMRFIERQIISGLEGACWITLGEITKQAPFTWTSVPCQALTALLQLASL